MKVLKILSGIFTAAGLLANIGSAIVGGKMQKIEISEAVKEIANNK